MEVNAQQAPEVVAALGRLHFEHLLDIGCGTADWPIAFLQAVPGARATLYDLPRVLPLARNRVEAAGLTDRVSFVDGDFTVDEALPKGADLALVFGVAHQNSRQQNRELFAKVHAALRPGGHIMVRGNVMNSDHTAPLFGAMFAILMLVRTESGTTYSFEETAEDLEVVGFQEPQLFRHKRDIDSIIRARKKDDSPGLAGGQR
jgi:SAM-dependent methyltransferase